MAPAAADGDVMRNIHMTVARAANSTSAVARAANSAEAAASAAKTAAPEAAAAMKAAEATAAETSGLGLPGKQGEGGDQGDA